MPRSLLDLLQRIPDPRGRRGRVYPLYGLLAVLILAAMHGENSLLGMWEWAKEREARLVNQAVLGVWGRPHLPCLGTFWYALCHLDVGALERVLREWVAGERNGRMPWMARRCGGANGRGGKGRCSL